MQNILKNRINDAPFILLFYSEISFNMVSFVKLTFSDPR